MMRKGGGTRSLFASLPWDLKQSLRSQSLDVVIPLQPKSEVEIKAERILQLASTNGLLSTQPKSSSDVVEADSSRGGVNETEAGHNRRAGDAGEDEEDDLENRESSGGALQRPTPPSSLDYPPTPMSYTDSARKRRKGKNKAPVNRHLGHPWDCTGLVSRYQDYSEVPTHLAKYFAQRHLLLPQYDTLPLLLDETGWFSITPQPIASHIADRCQGDVIIDAFCGVGGNAVEFARTCERVIAIDNDMTRLRLARHNALQCGLADRIEFILADFVTFAKAWTSRSSKSGNTNESVDVVFLSPPWGGPEYLTFTNDTTVDPAAAPIYPLSAIEPIPGDELFQLASALTPNIAYYLPRNVDIDQVSRLARSIDSSQNGEREREWVEVEEEWVGDRLKAVTAYFGGLIAEE